jgi:nitrous oxidase accessory protein
MYKSKKILYVLNLFLSFTFINLNAKSIEVCSSCKIKSIIKAIDYAKDHDTILIKKGTYKEFNIIVDKAVTIIGENFPIIDGDLKGEIFTIISNLVTIDGLFIINVGRSDTKDNAAIRIKRSKKFTIQNNIFQNIFFGIYIEKSVSGKIYNNKIIGDAKDEFNSGNGIQLWYSKNISIEKNTIQNVRDGIYLEFSDYCTVINNISENNLRYGLHFMFSNNDDYRNNHFRNNGSGVAVMFSKKIEMHNNTFQKNWGTASYGLLLKEINDSNINNNIFEKNTVGINVEGSNRITFKNNNFIKNGWAVRIRGACYANIFVGNNFMFNSFDLSYNTGINDNSFNKNYWSNYRGYDLNKDGIGDVPYRPVKLFSYVVNKSPETIILLRSLLTEIIDFSEKVTPLFTPKNLLDNSPLIKKVK